MDGVIGTREIQKDKIRLLSLRELAHEPLEIYDKTLIADILIRIITELADIQDRLNAQTP